MDRVWRGALAALALMLAGGPARADFSACESAMATTDLDQQIMLYTLCITKGGVGAAAVSGAFNNRGVAYLAKGDIEHASRDIAKALEYDDRWGVSYLNRGRIRLASGDFDGAEADFDRAAKLNPNRIWPQALVSKASVRVQRGDFAGALAAYDKAIKVNKRSSVGYNSKAWLLATAYEPSIRNGQAAVEIAQQAVKLDNGPASRDTLAAAYAEAGMFDLAVAEQTKAIEMMRAKKLGPVEPFEARLALYQSRTAYHEAKR